MIEIIDSWDFVVHKLALPVLMTLCLFGGATIARMEAPAILPAPDETVRTAGPTLADHPEQYRRSDFRAMRLAGPFPAEVTDVIDGDTFEARVTVWLGHEVRTRVRLLGIDAAEMGSTCDEERELAVASRNALMRLVGRSVQLSDVRFDKYGGRVLARARTRETADVSAQMLADGFAIAYDGGRRQAWCDVAVSARK